MPARVPRGARLDIPSRPVNATQDKTQQRTAEDVRDAQVTARNVRLNDLRSMMQTAAGRRFVWAFLEDARVFGEADSTDANVILSDRGRRSYALHVWRNLGRFCLDLRQLMERENLQCS